MFTLLREKGGEIDRVPPMWGPFTVGQRQALAFALCLGAATLWGAARANNINSLFESPNTWLSLQPTTLVPPTRIFTATVLSKTEYVEEILIVFGGYGTDIGGDFVSGRLRSVYPSLSTSLTHFLCRSFASALCAQMVARRARSRMSGATLPHRKRGSR